jgi:hypothetical protein
VKAVVVAAVAAVNHASTLFATGQTERTYWQDIFLRLYIDNLLYKQDFEKEILKKA